MEIKYDYPPFQKALKAFWSVFNGRSVCAVDETGILGGCGFSQNNSVETVAFILGLRPGWASRQLYAEILRFPFEKMGAEKCVAGVGSNVRSANICTRLGGVSTNNRVFVFTKSDSLTKAEEFLC